MNLCSSISDQMNNVTKMGRPFLKQTKEIQDFNEELTRRRTKLEI